MRFPDEADPPKLSLFSLPNKQNQEEPPGMLTPPLRTSVSVPFQWEEAPGRPRPRPSTITDAEPKTESARSLDLPPRLLINVEANSNMASPTTVLDGPYMGKGGWSSFRRSPSEIWGPKKDRPAISFGSARWGSFKKSSNKEAVGSSIKFEYFSSSSSSSSSVAADHKSSVGSAGNTKVKITRIRRRTSFMSFSDHKSTRSPLWASIYESFKQVVPWKRRH